jgi:hypothetical protein
MVERAFIVGVQRCGTTFLYHLLDQHPQITMARPVRPEPKVFLGDSVTGDAAAYDAQLFPHNPPSLVRGEKSTSYLEHDQALDRVCATFPEARFIVVLRDPVERALSHYRFSVDNGLEKRPLDEALTDDIEGREPSYAPTISVSPYAYVKRGRYLDQLQRLERHVSIDSVCTVIIEDLTLDESVMSSVFRFVGVEDAFRPSIGVPTNASSTVTDVPTHVRDRLRSYFAPLNEELGEHLGRRLDHWQ